MQQFCSHVVQTKGVLLLPGDLVYGMENHFRIGFGRKNFPIVLEKFDEYLTQVFFSI